MKLHLELLLTGFYLNPSSTLWEPEVKLCWV